jgi:wyosine [tRNA(Phe)-imidazoG37] synthetase (radical SAM superfamily)
MQVKQFSYKEIYFEAGKNVLEVNILPEKYCNFDCIFCPIGRSNNQVDKTQSFENTEEAVLHLSKTLEKNKVDLVFINSAGEAIIHEKIEDIIKMIHDKEIAVRLLSNGYLLNNERYIEIANQCEEVIGEVKVITEEDFKKLQRPIDGYTLENHLSSLIEFNRQFHGKFILEITIIKGYNDDEQSIQKIEEIIRKIDAEKLIVITMDGPFEKKLGVTGNQLKIIRERLESIR